MNAFENWLMGLTWTQFWVLVAAGFAFPSLLLWAGEKIAEGRAKRRALAREVPYWPTETIEAITSAAQCTLCRPSGFRPCTCTATCGHPACIGDYTMQGGVTYEQALWLRALDRELGL